MKRKRRERVGGTKKSPSIFSPSYALREQYSALSYNGAHRVRAHITPSIVYKRHAIRDTSQIFEKNKRQRLVSAIDLRDS